MPQLFTTQEATELVKRVVKAGLLKTKVGKAEFRGKASKLAGIEYGATGDLTTTINIAGRKYNATLRITGYQGDMAQAATVESKPFVTEADLSDAL